MNRMTDAFFIRFSARPTEIRRRIAGVVAVDEAARTRAAFTQRVRDPRVIMCAVIIPQSGLTLGVVLP